MKQIVDVYDFDGTIYDGDSSIDFYLFCLKKNFRILLFFPLQFFFFLFFKLGIVSRKKFKEKFFKFLKYLDNLDTLVECFWNENFTKIKSFYLNKDHSSDVIISASPEFLIKSVGKRLKVKSVIATNMSKDGTIIGENCYGNEKVRRFKQKYPNLSISNVYTDSFSDIPIMNLGKKSFIVDKNEVFMLDMYQANNNKFKLSLIGKKMLNLLFVVSVPFLTLLLCGGNDLKNMKLLIILSFISGIFINRKLIKTDIYANIDFRYFLFSILFCLYSVGILKEYTNVGIVWINNVIVKIFGIYFSASQIRIIISILSLPSMITFVYYLSKFIFSFIKNEYFNLSSMEKKLLLIVLFFSFILTTFIYNKTNVFYMPTNSGGVINYDVIYTTDTGSLNRLNAYANIGSAENDLRQPLFGVFALPFAVISEFISSFFKFIPHSYYIVFGVIQILLIMVSLIFIGRMLKLKGLDELLFILISMSTFSFILFSFVYEQYIISFFYLILTIYVWLFYKRDVNYCYIGAVGTLLTSGIFLITITVEKITNFSKYIYNVFKCFIGFLIISILSGQFLIVFKLYKDFTNLMTFSGKSVLFFDRLKQFFYFVKTIFISPVGIVEQIDGIYRYSLIKVDFVSRLGILIFLLCFVSFIINRKNIFAKISFFWVIFSFLILCVFGWGTQENGLILYSLYFFWAYISLIVLFINKIIKSRFLKLGIYSIIIIIMLYFNLSEFINIVRFGVSFYGILS